MASSIFGGVANAITGGPKLSRVSYSPALDAQLGALTDAQAQQRAANAGDVARIGAQASRAAGQMEALNPEDMAVLQGIINNRTDPFQTYQNVGNYQFSLLDRLASGLAEQGRAGESRRMAALGYGGSGRSTYGSNTLLDRISRNLTPVYASTLSNIGRDATSVDAGRLNQNAQTAAMIRERAAIPGRSLPLYQLPLQTRMDVNEAEIANLLGLGDAWRNNTAGFREKQTALGNLASSLDSAVDTGLSLYTGGLFGGGGGGLGGILGGGRQPSGGNPFGPSGYGNFSIGYNSGAWTPPWRN